MAELYEIVIFTASILKYAKPIYSKIDPAKHSSQLLFRDHCTVYNNLYVKDLTRLGRHLSDIIIIDNSPSSYLF